MRDKTKVLFGALASLVLLAGLMTVSPSPAAGELLLVQPDPGVGATFVGMGGYSADGLGQDVAGGTIQADVPAGSTVEQAYLYGSYFQGVPTAVELAIDFDGVVSDLTVLDTIEPSAGFFLTSARADVTAQVAAKVGTGGGITDFVVGSAHYGLDGVGLVVIYSNPGLPETTIAVLDGAQATTGDSATFHFVAPLDTTVPGFGAQLSLGIGFSSQQAPGPACGSTGQHSTVDVNGQRLTSCAGNADDGDQANGELITVGGVGDSLNNPVDPYATNSGEDDELYDLTPFLSDGDLSLTIETQNPSNDDIVFLAVVSVTADASVTVEICDDGIDNDDDGLVDGDDPDCVTEPPTPENPAYMTGGGRVDDVSHGFVLHCEVIPGQTDNLQINWGSKKDRHRFHMTEILDSACNDAEEISEGHPMAGFDTLTGAGIGRLDGVDGATVTWELTDAGEPGRDDTISFTIADADGMIVLEADGMLRNGNHQAHPATT